jgi:predicted MFS family arabinose efflux permease
MLGWLNGWIWSPRQDGKAAGGDAVISTPLGIAALARRLIPMVVWSTGLYCVYTYLGTGLAAVGFSAGQTASAIFVYGCGAIVGVSVGGRAADRFGVKLTASASFAGLCVCLLALRLALDANRFVEPVLGVASAVAQLFFPAQQAGLANDFPQQRATVLAWNNSALFFGISLGSLVGREAIASGSFGANLLISAAIALSGCVLNLVLAPGRASLETER